MPLAPRTNDVGALVRMLDDSRTFLHCASLINVTFRLKSNYELIATSHLANSNSSELPDLALY